MTNIQNFEKKMEQNLKFGQHLEHLFPNKVPTFLILKRFSIDMLRRNDNILHDIPEHSEKHCSRYDKSFQLGCHSLYSSNDWRNYISSQV